MKKLLYAVAAFAVLFTSCAKDDVVTPVEDKEALVSFCVNSPAVATRYGEGEEATTLYWAVYNADGSIVEALKGLKEIKLSTTVDLKLIQGREYDVLFWAADAEAPYEVDWTNKTMTVDYQNLEANQETYDAFFKYESLGRVSGSMSKTIELTRPFAQLNIATGDTTDATNAELTVAKTEVKVSNIYTKLNFATGFVSEPKEATFVMANKADGKITANGNEYDHIAMNYILVGKENENSQDKKLVNVELTINDEGLTRNYSSVPVQRNYRTNIVGNILTSTADFNVVIIPGFETPDNVTIGFDGAKVNGIAYETLEEAIANAYDGDVIELSDGEYEFPINIATKGTRAGARQLGFIGQGDNTVISFSSQAGGTDGGLNCYADGLSLSFQDLKIVSPNTGSAYTGGFGRVASVYFKDCTYEGQYRSLAKTKFEGCTIDPQTSYIYTDAADVDFIDCTFNASKGKAIQVYSDNASAKSTVNITNCTFTADEIGYTWDNKPVTAIDINSIGSKFTVNINNSTADGFGVGEYSDSDLWNIKGGAQHITVNINGEIANVANAEMVGNGLWKAGSTYSVTNAEGLALLNSKLVENSAGVGVAVEILSDIDFTGKTWTPVRSHIDWKNTVNSFNGNGHTIKNLTINGQAMFTIFANSADVVFKNVIFDNAKVNGGSSINCAIIVGQTYNNLRLENVDVKNSTIVGSYKVATLVGTVYNEGSSTITATLKDCDVTTTSVKSTGYDFCTTGMVAFVYTGDNDNIAFENCSISDVKLYGPDNGYALHAAIYTTDADTNDLINEAEGVTVENVTFENI